MARALLESAGGAATSFLPPWLAALGMVVASVWIVSFAVFLCGRSSHADDDLPKKKPAAAKTSRPASVAPTKARSSARSGSTVVDPTGMYGAAYVSGVSAGGCHGHGGGGGCVLFSSVEYTPSCSPSFSRTWPTSKVFMLTSQ
nr:uncharacterized protein LOC127304131 [Lolium perenne]